MRFIFRHSALTSIAALCTLGASAVHGKTASEVFEQASASTVVVKNADSLANKQSTGSGVIVADGQVVTNCHVIKNAKALTVRTVHKEYVATLQYSDWARDVCSLTAIGLEAPPALLGQSTTLKVGAKVYALGTPKGLAFTFSDGIVSGFRERINGRHIQTTAAISKGSSGGGLFDEHGALVGLTTFYMANGQNLNFAIPIEWVSELAQRSRPDTALTPTPMASMAGMDPPESQWQNTSKRLEASSDWVALLAHSERWTRAESDNEDAWKSRGIALYRTGQTDLSVEAWQKAVRINPDDAEVWFLLGAAYTRASRSAQAISAFQHAVNLDPQDDVAWYSLGQHFSQTGQRNEVRYVYKQLKKLDTARAEHFFSHVVLP